MYDRFKVEKLHIDYLQKQPKLQYLTCTCSKRKSEKFLNFCTVPTCPTFAPNRVRQRKESRYSTMWKKIHSLETVDFHEIFVKNCESKIPYIISTLTQFFFSSLSWSSVAFFHKRYKIPFDNCTNSTFFLHFFLVSSK